MTHDFSRGGNGGNREDLEEQQPAPERSLPKRGWQKRDVERGNGRRAGILLPQC